MTANLQLPFPPPPALSHQSSSDELRLLVFNTQHASPLRARRQAEWIADQEAADIVILSEVGAGPGGTALVDALSERGYPFVHAPDSPSADYRSIIASRGAELTPMRSEIAVLPHRGPAGTIKMAGTYIALLGLYVPSRGPKGQRNESKRAFQSAVMRALPSFLLNFNGPVIVAGDLNVVEPMHQPHHKVFGDWEYDFYRSFAATGLADAFRALHPRDIEHSWFGRSGQGYRFDHAFVTAQHVSLVRSCGYMHEPRRQGLTDHAALTLTLGPIASSC